MDGTLLAAKSAQESAPVCWICLEEASDSRSPLRSPCTCPRKVHPECMARWQFQQAGKAEEKNCRFCKSVYEDWRDRLTPDALKNQLEAVQPCMVVCYQGEKIRINVSRGPDGRKEFSDNIRKLFNMGQDMPIALTFGCMEPMSGQMVSLTGIEAFEAALHCAAVVEASNQQKFPTQQMSTTALPQ